MGCITPKWSLREYSRLLIGNLENVYVTAPGAHRWDYSDGDTNIVIEPDDDHQELLINRFGRPNANGKIECEVNIPEDRRDQYTNWVSSMIGTTVMAIGVYVDDDGHGHKTELHPMDLIVGRVTRSLTSDWISRLAQDRKLQIGRDLLAYRFAVASDDREGFWCWEEGPPLSDVTRRVEALLEFPDPPHDGWEPMVDWRIEQQTAADVQIRSLGGAHTHARVRATCQAHNHGGPGAALGEVVAYWVDPQIPRFVLSPTTINFGTIVVDDRGLRTFHITNVSQVPFVLSVAAAPTGTSFTWRTLNTVTVGPGEILDMWVEFEPRSTGLARSQLEVQTNAEGNSHHIELTGSGRAGTVP